ncbi:MAG: hypothetical protein K0S53_1967 [Bacteroidetes bacterium]|jgi:hypothetical protein|nr:hypothetical protein [Bacteroidota bacterium]
MKYNGNQTEKVEIENQKTLIANQKEYISMLEKIMTFISHDIRQQVAHIQGLSYLLKPVNSESGQSNKKLLHIKKSALLLDARTRTLSALIYKKILSLKKAEEARIIQKPIIR